MTSSQRRSIAVTGVALVLFVPVAWKLFQSPQSPILDVGHCEASPSRGLDCARQITEQAPFVPVVHLRLSPPTWDQTSREPLIELFSVYYFFNPSSWRKHNVDSICIDRILVGWRPYTQPIERDIGTIQRAEDLLARVGSLCSSPEPVLRDSGGSFVPPTTTLYAGLGLDPGYLFAGTGVTAPSVAPQELRRHLALSSPSRLFRYPYDDYKLEIGLQVSYRLIRESTVVSSGTLIPVSLWELVGSAWREWDVEIEAAEDRSYSTAIQGELRSLHFELSRPLYLRVTFPLVVVILATIIWISPLADTLGAFFQITVAVLFGIFALRQGLVPAESGTSRTLVDLAIMVLYGGLFVALAAFVLCQTAMVSRRATSELASTNRSRRFHKVDCPTIAGVPRQNRIVFGSIEAANSSGRQPCRVCRPDQD